MYKTTNKNVLLKHMPWKLHNFITQRLLEPTERKDTLSNPIVKIAVGGIALGLAVMLLTVSMVKGFEHEVQQRIIRFGSAITLEPAVQSDKATVFKISEDSLNVLKRVKGIKAIYKTISMQALYRQQAIQDGIMCMGLSSHFQRPDLSSRMVSGQSIDFNSNQPEKSVIISDALARRLNLKVGAYFPIHVLVQRNIIDSVLGRVIQKQVPLTRKWKIKGVFKNEFSDLDRQLVYTDIRLLQQLLNCSAEACTAMEVQLVEKAETAPCADQLNLLLPYTLLARTVQERFSVLFAWFEKLHVNAVIIFLLMLLVSLVNMSTALLIFILEHTRMVGQLLTLGYHKSGLQVLFLNIGMRFFLRGMLWGNLIALILGALQYFFHFVKLDEATYYVSYVVLEPSLGDFLWINAVFMGVGALTMILPTLILSKLTPLKTLNFD